MSEEENKEEEKQDLPSETVPEAVSEDKEPVSPEPSDSSDADSEEAKPQKKAKESKADSDSDEKKSSDDESGAQEAGKKKEETAEDLLGANIEQVKVRKAKGSKNISSGICFIVATFNNTNVTITTPSSWGDAGEWCSLGGREATCARKGT